MWSQQRKSRWQKESLRKAGDQTQYDAVLGFESLAEFLREGEIPFLQKAESHLHAVKEGRYRIVAVVGLFDKGKTWLLNKLFGVTRPQPGQLFGPLLRILQDEPKLIII